MSSKFLLCLSLALSIQGGALQPVPIQPPQASYAEGSTAVLQCPLQSGKIQDYHVFWFQQKPSKSPAFILKDGNNGQIDRSSSFDARFVPIRDANTNAYILQIQKVQTDESATYFCLAEGNYFQIAVSGSGTRLSITGGQSAKVPSSVIILSDVSQKPGSSDVHALCIVEDFYPGLLEIKWNAAGKEITEGVTSGQVTSNDDGTYTTSSILNVSRHFFNSVTPIQCSVSHESSGAKIERSLEQCMQK
ncbi:immunoglobulin lambda-1 light chain-like [Pituophis catenifer annectens]|uniref:immunoglobulin lambda-1 light chain-like n=1 Tax=Pituophis catenifer annectens TaxID=94852 RepID=UPI003991B23A